MRAFGKATLVLSAVIAASVFPTACGEQIKDTGRDCTATYLKVNTGRNLLFLVGCKENLESLPPPAIKGLRELLIKQKVEPLKNYLETFRKQAGKDRLTICLKVYGRLEVLDEDSLWSCLLSRGSEASAVLFGPKAPILDLDRVELMRVADEIDRLIVTGGLGLLGETDRLSFRSGVAAKLNVVTGGRTVDDIYLYSYNLSEDLP